ncbi:MAG: class II aldolase/adducin family protein [Promethearchaeota archaeon]|nr:MAG: class II aldolase/adducin family protein [Candidatus Lokiarchaeota archaeon]
MVNEEKIREDIVRAAKAIFERGLVEAGEGNVSIRGEKEDEFYITPSFNQYFDLKPENVVHMNFEGETLSSGKLPSTEAKMHTAIYKARKKVNAVIHTHSTYATMLSVLRKSIPIIMEEQVVFLGGGVDVSSYGEAHTTDLGSVALNALDYKNSALLANHGSILCGRSIDHAVKFAELTEKLAKIYWGALQAGEPYVLDDEDLSKFKAMFKGLFSNAPRKQLKNL